MPFSIRTETCPKVSNFEKIISRGLHMEMPQSYANTNHVVTMGYVRVKIFYYLISSFEKVMVSKMLLVCLEHVLGKIPIFFNKMQCLEK